MGSESIVWYGPNAYTTTGRHIFHARIYQWIMQILWPRELRFRHDLSNTLGAGFGSKAGEPSRSPQMK